jgi:hypothetical protein
MFSVVLADYERKDIVELMYSVPVSRTCIDKLLGLIHIGADRHAPCGTAVRQKP